MEATIGAATNCHVWSYSPERFKAEARLRLFRWPALALVSILVGLIAGCAGSARRAPALDWHPLNDELTAHVPILALAFDPAAPQIMVAGGYDPTGLYRSEDGGQTWTAADHDLEGPVYALLADPAPSGVLLAGTANGLYRRNDDRSGWQRPSGLPAPMAVYALAHDATGTLYLGSDQPQAFRSHDGGESWEPLAPLPGETAILSLAVSAGGDRLLAGTDGRGLFLSLDQGRTWRPVEEVGQAIVAGLWFVGEDGLTIYARTEHGLVATTDGGQTWQAMATQVEGQIDTLTFDPTTGWLYLATNSGYVYRSRAGSADWEVWGFYSAAGAGPPRHLVRRHRIRPVSQPGRRPELAAGEPGAGLSLGHGPGNDT